MAADDADCSFSSQSLSVEYYVYAVLDARCSLLVACWRRHLPSVSAVCCPRAESSGERPLQPRESHLLSTPRSLLQLPWPQLTRSNRRFVAWLCLCVRARSLISISRAYLDNYVSGLMRPRPPIWYHGQSLLSNSSFPISHHPFPTSLSAFAICQIRAAYASN